MDADALLLHDQVIPDHDRMVRGELHPRAPRAGPLDHGDPNDRPGPGRHPQRRNLGRIRIVHRGSPVDLDAVNGPGRVRARDRRTDLDPTSLRDADPTAPRPRSLRDDLDDLDLARKVHFERMGQSALTAPGHALEPSRRRRTRLLQSQDTMGSILPALFAEEIRAQEPGRASRSSAGNGRSLDRFIHGAGTIARGTDEPCPNLTAWGGRRAPSRIAPAAPVAPFRTAPPRGPTPR